MARIKRKFSFSVTAANSQSLNHLILVIRNIYENKQHYIREYSPHFWDIHMNMYGGVTLLNMTILIFASI